MKQSIFRPRRHQVALAAMLATCVVHTTASAQDGKLIADDW
ncbi:MAG: hypothetical protein RLZZ271_556, partial [Pseudomonadota bacterium]